jgi:hypothetical protein
MQCITHPSCCCSVQFFFVAKVTQLFVGHLAVVSTDELKHNFFGMQDSIWGSTTNELLDALVYSLLLVLRGNPVFSQSAT